MDYIGRIVRASRYSSVVKTLPGQARRPGFNTQELSAFTSLSVTTKMSVNVLSGESPVPC